MKYYVIILLTALNFLLSSCVAVVVVGAAAGMIVYDKRSVPTLENDARIYHEITNAIARDKRFYGARIEVISFNRIVLLVGETPTSFLRSLAEKIAQKTPAVRRVYNEMIVGNFLNLSTRTKDALITGQIRSFMLNKKGLESGSIRIVTENGVVYLMGIVTHEQANLAVQVARETNEVQKVVKVFQYIM